MADVKTISGVTVDIPTHAADLDAHTMHVSEIMRTGEYIQTMPTELSEMNLAITANRLYAAPFIVPRNLSIDFAAFRLITGIDAKVARLGIYANGTNCYPGALIEDWGEVAVGTAQQGAVAINITDRALTKGLYWMSIVSDAAITVTASRLSPLILGQVAVFANPQVGWSVAFTYAALPDPFTAAGSLAISTIPLVLPRLKSLD